MAECPLRNSVVEKDPDKSRLKCSLANATVEDNVDGSAASRAHDGEMPKRAGQEEGGVTKTEDELLTISESKFQSLLQEASQPLFDRNSEKSQLLRKVIDETNFKDSPCQASLGRTWGCRRDGGGRRSDRRTRLDSCGHGANSAAACTTQGGSLQNLHGKPESKKLHKSGSLITFPASSGIGAETCSELEALKLFLTTTVAATTLPRRNSGSVPSARSKGASAPASAEPVCDGVGAESAASSPSDPSRECSAGPETETGLNHNDLKTFDRVRPALDQKSFSKSTEEEEEEDAEVAVEEIEMMDIDRHNDDLDSETLPLLRNGLSATSLRGSQASEWVASRPYGSMDGFRSRQIKSLEVDASVSMPLSLKSSQSIGYLPSKDNYNDYSLLDKANTNNTEVEKTNGSSRNLDENGNPQNTVPCSGQEQLPPKQPPPPPPPPPLVPATLQQPREADKNKDKEKDKDKDGQTGDVDKKLRRKKRASKQVPLDPMTLPGYFGGMPIEDILKRINSTEDLVDEKLANNIDPKKKGAQKDKDSLKSSGTKIKKTAPNREVSKKNLENDMSRLNGSKENIIGHGLKDVLIDSIADSDGPIALKSTFDSDCKPNEQIMADKSLKPKNDELSHQLRDYVASNLVRLMKPNTDILVEAFPLSTYLDLKEDGASKCPAPHELTNHVNCDDDAAGQHAKEKQTSVQPVSSFAVDFYSTPEAQLVLEDSEFCEVRKKKKNNKPRSAKSDAGAGAHYKNYYYASSGGDGSTYSGSSGSSVVNEDGRRAQPASWANLSNLPHHYRSQRGLEDARRKSTSSVPHSEHSSADNSDVESVHSLPVSSTTPKTVVGKTSSSSSCTPQASYADIAKMATTTNLYASRRPLVGPKPDVAQFLEGQDSPNPAETKRDASTSTAEPCETDVEHTPSDQCEADVKPDVCSNSASRPDLNGDINKGVLDFINSESLRAENLPLASLPAVPTDNAVSIAAVEASSLGYSAVLPQDDSETSAQDTPVEKAAPLSWGTSFDAGIKPGVVFVGALDMPVEELSEVTFGFDVNEELLRMTAVHWRAARTETPVPSRSPGHEEDATVYHFTASSDDACTRAPAEQRLEEFCAAEESREATSPPGFHPEDTDYFNYQNVVDFIGRAWDGVQEELEIESQGGARDQRAKVQYYSRTE